MQIALGYFLLPATRHVVADRKKIAVERREYGSTWC